MVGLEDLLGHSGSWSLRLGVTHSLAACLLTSFLSLWEPWVLRRSPCDGKDLGSTVSAWGGTTAEQPYWKCHLLSYFPFLPLCYVYLIAALGSQGERRWETPEIFFPGLQGEQSLAKQASGGGLSFVTLRFGGLCWCSQNVLIRKCSLAAPGYKSYPEMAWSQPRSVGEGRRWEGGQLLAHVGWKIPKCQKSTTGVPFWVLHL